MTSLFLLIAMTTAALGDPVQSFRFAYYKTFVHRTGPEFIGRWFIKGSEAYDEDGIPKARFQSKDGRKWYFCWSAESIEEFEKVEAQCE